ncbi:hypothetical protein, partial [Atlantibacter hermannii]|uniref:hypothetical protein n=1 Tax=Atlantibacter hermannii TaxID=565 RepID=UPI00289DFA8A
ARHQTSRKASCESMRLFCICFSDNERLPKGETRWFAFRLLNSSREYDGQIKRHASNNKEGPLE